jgi:hypothetical protein
MRGTEIAFVEHGQYCLAHPQTALPYVRLDTPTDRLLHLSASGEGGVVIRTGTIDGPVRVTVETFEAPPDAPPDPAEWEHVEDLVAVSRGDLVQAIVEIYEIEDAPTLRVAPGHRYHVRLAARGFAAGREKHTLDTDDEPVEHHLVQLWRED